MRIEIVVYDGCDDLDAFGPYEVLCHAARRVPGWEIAMVGARGPATITTAHGVELLVGQRLGEQAPDGIVVPGGGGWHGQRSGVGTEADRGELPERLAELAPRCRFMASVCTGARLLVAAGLIGDRPAVTHHNALDDLRATGAMVIDDARVVDDGDLLTAAGITSGIDLALHLVAREATPAAAKEVADLMAYRPHQVTRIGSNGAPELLASVPCGS